MLLDYFAGRRASHVHRHISAADYDHLLADGELVAQIHVEQKVDAFVNSVEIDAGNAEIAAAMRADCQQHRVESLAAKISDGKLAPRRMIQFQRNVAGLENFADL